MQAPAKFLITPLSRESIARMDATAQRVQPASIRSTATPTAFSGIVRFVVTSLALLSALCSPLSAQNVGDFILPEKTSSTGRVTNRYWPKGAGTLWGTNASSLPIKITVGSGLSLNTTTGTLTATGGGSGGATTLDELSDVVITTPASGQILRYNGTNWVNYTHAFLTSSDLSGYLTSSTAASTYQPLNSKLTSITALANAAGVLTNNGSGTFSFTNPHGPAGEDLDRPAYVHETLGNDATTTGSPSEPYATAQAAYDDGFRTFVITGDAGTLNVDGSGQELWLYGRAAGHFLGTTSGPDSPIPAFDVPAPQRSIITVRNNDATTDHVHLYSDKRVMLNLTGLDSTGTGCEFHVFNGIVGTVSIVGADGATDLENDIGEAKNGTLGGTLLLNDCVLIGPTSLAGGAAGEDINGPGTDGTKGTLTVFQSTIDGTYDFGVIAAVNSTIAGSPPGVTTYYNAVVNGTPLGTIANGDKGSITTSNFGSTWTIDTGAVTNAMLAGSIDLTSKVTGILPPANMGTGSSITTKYLRGDGTWQTISGGGDALTSGNLSQFAATTSAQLRGVLSDESGTGEFLTTNGSAAALTSFPTLNQSTTGNAATATALQTARTINGTSFDGTANITVTAAAGTLTGSTLASGVTASSLTSVGTLLDLTVTNTITGSISGNAATVTTNANLTGDVTSTGNATAIASGVIVNADINASAAIALSKLATDPLARANHTGTQAASTITALPVEIGVAISDETTALTTGTAKVTFRMPHAMTLTAVRLSLTTVSSSGTPTVDINEAGASVLSTKLSCDASEKTSTTAATAAVISDSALADDAEITIDIDTAGTGATGAKVWLIGTR